MYNFFFLCYYSCTNRMLAKQLRNQKFINNYSEEFDFIDKSRIKEHCALFTVCYTHIKIKSSCR